MADKPKEKVLGSKVVKEEVIEPQGKGFEKRLGIALLIVSVGAAGYGVGARGYQKVYLEKLTKPYVLKITDHAIREGYTQEIWEMFPGPTRHYIMKRELSGLPLKQSWSIVRPSLERKIKYEWREFRSDVAQIYSEVTKSEGFRSTKKEIDDHSRKKAREIHHALKQYLLGD